MATTMPTAAIVPHRTLLLTPSVSSKREKPNRPSDDAADTDAEAGRIRRGPTHERLIEEPENEQRDADDDEREKQLVATGELLQEPLVGDPLFEAFGAALILDLVDVHLFGQALGQHEHEASHHEERRQRDDEAR